MASSGGSAPTKPVPCTTGYVNGVCGSGATTGGNHGPGLPGGACPSGQVRGPNGCTGPRTGTGSSTSPGSGSTSHLPPGQNHGGGQTIMPVTPHGNGAQPMISHSTGTQSTRSTQFSRPQNPQPSRPQNPQPSRSGGSSSSGHRR
jgi:hypothetical protein